MKIIIEQDREKRSSLALRNKLLNILKKTVYRDKPSDAESYLNYLDEAIASSGGDEGGQHNVNNMAETLRNEYATAHKELQAAVKNKLDQKNKPEFKGLEKDDVPTAKQILIRKGTNEEEYLTISQRSSITSTRIVPGRKGVPQTLPTTVTSAKTKQSHTLYYTDVVSNANRYLDAAKAAAAEFESGQRVSEEEAENSYKQASKN